MSPDTHKRYTLALTELVSTLSVTEYKHIDVAGFCERHGLQPVFLEALRDLDALVYDFVSESGYQRTPALSLVTPERVLAQSKGTGRRLGQKTARAQLTPSESPEVNKPPLPIEERQPEEPATPGPAGLTSDDEDSADSAYFYFTNPHEGTVVVRDSREIKMPAREPAEAVSEAGEPAEETPTHLDIPAWYTEMLKKEERDWAEQVRQAEAALLEPTRLPYTVTIDSAGLTLTLDVKTGREVQLLQTALTHLNN